MEDFLLNLHQNPDKINKKKASVKIWKQKITREEVEKLTTKDELTGATSWPSPSRSLASGQSLWGQELHHPLHLPGGTQRKGGDGSERKGQTHWWLQRVTRHRRAHSCTPGWPRDAGLSPSCWIDFPTRSSCMSMFPVSHIMSTKWELSGSTGRCCSSHTTGPPPLSHQPWITDQQPEEKSTVFNKMQC